jgi:precorrin-6A/cobalt-precorrin-6A reductase
MKIAVFAGTTEGREISQFLAEKGVAVTACVATEYGNMVMPNDDMIEVRTGRLDEQQMAEVIDSCSLVIDATHPYADKATENIKAACKKACREYIRLYRPPICAERVITVRDTMEAVKYLNKTHGNVLLTTGSKELEAFTAVADFENRLFARVLPTPEVVEKCNGLGFKGKNLICMQGPFSFEMNTATLRQINAVYMVTKDTGAAGGFEEKITAAEEAGVTTILISRPFESGGITLAQLKEELIGRLGFSSEIQNERFPLFIDLTGKRVLVAGGGKIAERRAKALLEFGAEVYMVSPKLSDSLEQMVAENLLTCRRGSYDSGDIDNAFLVIAATDSREVNHRIYLDATEKGIFVSVADCRQECSFYFPAIFRLDGIVGGLVSQSGSSHGQVRLTAEKIRKMGFK